MLSRFAKNYLPLLFNIFTGDSESPKNPQKRAVFETIKCYMQVADQEVGVHNYMRIFFFLNICLFTLIKSHLKEMQTTDSNVIRTDVLYSCLGSSKSNKHLNVHACKFTSSWVLYSCLCSSKSNKHLNVHACKFTFSWWVHTLINV